MLDRWSIQPQSFGFTVKHLPGKLNVVPDALSRLFSEELHGELVPSEPRLAAICRNVSHDQWCSPRAPPEYEVSVHTLNDIVPVESYRDFFSSAVSVFPVGDTAQIAARRQDEFSAHFAYLRDPQSSPLPSKESKYTNNHFFLNEGMLFRSYLPGPLRKRSDFHDQLVVPGSLRARVITSFHD